MLTIFPEFKKIQLSDKNIIERYVNNFEPYSDFNFTSLLLWNINESTAYSFCNNNLIIKLQDYVTNEITYSVLGNNEIDATLKKISNITSNIKYVPEITIECLSKDNNHTIIEDRDEFDYIYKINDLVSLAGKNHKTTRNKINNFTSNLPLKFNLKHISFNNNAHIKSLLEIFETWKNHKNINEYDSVNELKAVSRLLEFGEYLNLSGILVYDHKKPIAFSINEIMPKRYGICHFQKTSIKYQNLDVYLTNLASRELMHFGCEYYNWEQDLGIDGLRRYKSKYRQFKFLKKYHVKLSSGTS